MLLHAFREVLEQYRAVGLEPISIQALCSHLALKLVGSFSSPRQFLSVGLSVNSAGRVSCTQVSACTMKSMWARVVVMLCNHKHKTSMIDISQNDALFLGGYGMAVI